MASLNPKETLLVLTMMIRLLVCRANALVVEKAPSLLRTLLALEAGIRLLSFCSSRLLVDPESQLEPSEELLALAAALVCERAALVDAAGSLVPAALLVIRLSVCSSDALVADASIYATDALLVPTAAIRLLCSCSAVADAKSLDPLLAAAETRLLSTGIRADDEALLDSREAPLVLPAAVRGLLCSSKKLASEVSLELYQVLLVLTEVMRGSSLAVTETLLGAALLAFTVRRLLLVCGSSALPDAEASLDPTALLEPLFVSQVGVRDMNSVDCILSGLLLLLVSSESLLERELMETLPLAMELSLLWADDAGSKPSEVYPNETAVAIVDRTRLEAQPSLADVVFQYTPSDIDAMVDEPWVLENGSVKSSLLSDVLSSVMDDAVKILEGGAEVTGDGTTTTTEWVPPGAAV